jgi:hypothetical protein
VSWIQMAWDRPQWLVLANERVTSTKSVTFLYHLSWQLASLEELCYMGFNSYKGILCANKCHKKKHTSELAAFILPRLIRLRVKKNS